MALSGAAVTAACTLAAVLSACAGGDPDLVTIGVVDTGVSVDAPQFTAYAIDQRSPDPSGEHGTLVLSALLGVAGDGAPLPPRRVVVESFDVGAEPTADDLAAAIEAALDADVDIVSISMGVRRGSPALEAAVDRAARQDTTIIAAAGNVRFLAADFPARYESVVAVGAVDAAGQAWSESGSPDVDTVARGVDVRLLDPEGTVRHASGTSFAAATVTHDHVLAMLDTR